MPKGRTLLTADSTTLDSVVRRVLRPERFFVAAGTRLLIEQKRSTDELWEIYGAQLLGPGQTREHARFDTWALYVDPHEKPAERPVVEVKWQPSTEQLHVTRSVEIYAWQAFESRPNVIESRLTKSWTRELVASIDPARMPDVDTLVAELAIYVEQAIHGTSRLAITSLENPLPNFALGQLAYLSQTSDSQQPVIDPLQLVANTSLDSRTLEVALRTVDAAEVSKLADSLEARLVHTPDPNDPLQTLSRNLFNQIALSPYTCLTDNLVDLLVACAQRPTFSAETITDIISHMLRHLVRHLTAFDLKTFHNQGANYPDALFLDRLLRAYIDLISSNVELFAGPSHRMRRRALRQAYWVRQSLESVRFPDAPTSPGENQCVLPDAFPPVSERQITDPNTRTRQLFEVGSTEQLVAEQVRGTFAASLCDLEHSLELRELGMAVFLDRPLGIFKPPGHPDRTPLVSYEAYSHRIAAQRLEDLLELQITKEQDFTPRLDELPELGICRGIPVSDVGGQQRAGVVSLADAAIVSDDFVFLRTTRRSLDDLLASLPESTLANIDKDTRKWLNSSPHVLLIRTKAHLLAGFDCQMKKRLTVKANAPVEYELRHGVERLRNGLSIKTL